MLFGDRSEARRDLKRWLIDTPFSIQESVIAPWLRAFDRIKLDISSDERIGNLTFGSDDQRTVETYGRVLHDLGFDWHDCEEALYRLDRELGRSGNTPATDQLLNRLYPERAKRLSELRELGYG